MADDVVIIKPTNAIVEITAPGPQGVAASAQIFYTHTQNSPSAVWTINHNLGGNPTAVVLDSAGTQCEGTHFNTCFSWSALSLEPCEEPK